MFSCMLMLFNISEAKFCRQNRGTNRKIAQKIRGRFSWNRGKMRFILLATNERGKIYVLTGLYITNL